MYCVLADGQTGTLPKPNRLELGELVAHRLGSAAMALGARDPLGPIDLPWRGWCGIFSRSGMVVGIRAASFLPLPPLRSLHHRPRGATVGRDLAGPRPMVSAIQPHRRPAWRQADLTQGDLGIGVGAEAV